MWKCVSAGCYKTAPHIAAAAFGVLVAAHPQPAGVATCKCHMVWYPDAPVAHSLDIPAPTPLQRLDRVAPWQIIAPGPQIVSAPWEDAAPSPGPVVVPEQQQSTPVPEPATWMLFVAAIAALLGVRRGRRSELDRRADALERL